MRFQVHPRRFVPEWNGNRQRPEREQVRISYRPYTVGEQAQVGVERLRRGRAVLDAAAQHRDVLLALQARITAGEAAADAELDTEIQAQAHDLAEAREPLYRLACERVLAVEQDGDRADTADDIWYVLSQAWDLMDEVAAEILGSAGLRGNAAPFSEPRSTGGSAG